MDFRKSVELPIGEAEIRHSDQLLLIGSCFTENMGKIFSANKFRCLINPFGILYNPLSIAEAICQMLAHRQYDENDLLCNHGMWLSLMHHGSFSSLDKNECLDKINFNLKQGADCLQKAKWLIITFGTARVYEWKQTGQIVGNCHKLPEKCFSRRLLEVDEILETYDHLFSDLRKVNPELNVLFTVSPIRHTRDGMHGNQVSKATLLLAIDKLCSGHSFCHYFPSYEIMIDELRDYRFYDADMVHPSQLAIEYIWECFAKSYFKNQTMDFLKEWESIRRGLEHRPFNPDSEEYLRFRSQILLKMERLKEKYPYLEMLNE